MEKPRQRRPFLSLELYDDHTLNLNWHDGRDTQTFELMSPPDWFQNWPPPPRRYGIYDRVAYQEPVYQLKLEMRKLPQVEFYDLSIPDNIVLGDN